VADLEQAVAMPLAYAVVRILNLAQRAHAVDFREGHQPAEPAISAIRL
jgi:hypothetical protein